MENLEHAKPTIFDEMKAEKSKAIKTLDKAKLIELQRIKEGWKYITSADRKTSTLKKL